MRADKLPYYIQFALYFNENRAASYKVQCPFLLYSCFLYLFRAVRFARAHEVTPGGRAVCASARARFACFAAVVGTRLQPSSHGRRRRLSRLARRRRAVFFLSWESRKAAEAIAQRAITHRRTHAHMHGRINASRTVADDAFSPSSAKTVRRRLPDAAVRAPCRRPATDAAAADDVTFKGTEPRRGIIERKK